MAEQEEIAIALRYEREEGGLPFVTASGRGAIAARIREVAKENNIPVRKDSDLAQILKTLDVGSPIPTAAFAAVAEILSYLYRLSAAQKEQSHE